MTIGTAVSSAQSEALGMVFVSWRIIFSDSIQRARGRSRCATGAFTGAEWVEVAHLHADNLPRIDPDGGSVPRGGPKDLQPGVGSAKGLNYVLLSVGHPLDAFAFNSYTD